MTTEDEYCMTLARAFMKRVNSLEYDLAALIQQERSAATKAGIAAAKAQVRELPDRWRGRAARCNDPKSPSIWVDCAEELEAWGDD